MEKEKVARTPPSNKTELILYRLDGIDKKLVDLQVLMTQTALQEQRIQNLETEVKKREQQEEDIVLLKAQVQTLVNQRKERDTKWWQVLLLVLSPIVTAVITFLLLGGFNAPK